MTPQEQIADADRQLEALVDAEAEAEKLSKVVRAVAGEHREIHKAMAPVLLDCSALEEGLRMRWRAMWNVEAGVNKPLATLLAEREQRARTLHATAKASVEAERNRLLGIKQKAQAEIDEAEEVERQKIAELRDLMSKAGM